jgi:hypothetical protein
MVHRQRQRRSRPRRDRGTGLSPLSRSRSQFRWDDVDDRVDTSCEVLGHPQQASKPVEEGKHYEVLAYTDWGDTSVPTVVRWSNGEVDDFTDPRRSLSNRSGSIRVELEKDPEYREWVGLDDEEDADFWSPGVRKRVESEAQREDSRQNTRKAIEYSERVSEEEHRRTIVDGKPVRVPVGEHLYLGRSVEDEPPRGYSSAGEVEGTCERILVDLEAGDIGRKTANSRLMRLKGIVEQTKQGSLGDKADKAEAIQAINSARASVGFKPVSASTGPVRPTDKQVEADRRNVEVAREAWMNMSPAESSASTPRRGKRERGER